MHTPHKILIVDDEQNVLDGYRRVIPKIYKIDYCSNSIEALEMVKTNKYIAVLSDISMPLMNGIALIKEINTVNPEIIKVIITGHTNIDNAIEAINQGHVFRFLSKPVSPESLIKTIEACFNQHENIVAKKQLFSLQAIKNEMESMIKALVKVVEIRDPYTAGHLNNVADMSIKVAEKLGWDEDRKMGLYLSALVHDIGKIYVPSEFLNKPGVLSNIEYSVIREHPNIGHEILSTVDFKWPISEIVHQHHEKIDGSGYPKGLKADQIMDEAQIIAICDIYDAMTNHRPYRPALSKDNAITYIRTLSNSHYNKNFIDMFMDVLAANKEEE